jgi:rare lipoprotein A
MDKLDRLRTTVAALVLSGTALVSAQSPVQIVWESRGQASSYGKERAGHRTSSGEVFNPRRLTAAHRTLPFGSTVLVTNLRNGRQVRVRINDRGPGYPGRIIDVSTAAARRLGFDGLADVAIQVLYYGEAAQGYSYLALLCRAGQGSRRPCSSYFAIPGHEREAYESHNPARGALQLSMLRRGAVRQGRHRPKGRTVALSSAQVGEGYPRGGREPGS